ncbi:MerR family transcriptional regulator [Zhihengliuella flava]|uniref:DNA-binding transcriptional MerR regulator n=1 Tax=Zhihengliuella flava TaxID=1285193 RepID=A0A931GFL2_9MICC|nr:TipAS antibiotic-recognition domain-containing protein [Zhihengliuella flava]MBG6084782.1 DNA-binding transcriptional MerR regulator [Zhihengliuella flava]
MTHREYPIAEVARLAGTTSRTLRHYDDVGLLPPSRVGHTGYRYYDDDALLRLQRILLLRQLGLPVRQIQDVLAAEGPATASSPRGRAASAAALRLHAAELRRQQERLQRQLAAVEHTLTTLEGGGELVAENMFDGFDHTQHKDEVTERWGAQAYQDSDRWWRSMGREEQAAWQETTRQLGADWAAAAAAGTDPASAAAQELAARHVAWLSGIPGTPGAGGEPDTGYILGLADMYVADPRFAANYGGAEGAEFVRAALREWAGR